MQSALGVWWILLLSLFLLDIVSAQLVYEQDIVQGGITAGGFSTGLGAGTGVVDLHIEPGSEIKKAHLITYSYGNPEATPIVVNGTNYFFDESERVAQFGHVYQLIAPISVYSKDITDDSSTDESVFEITIPSQDPLNGYFTAFIILIYENPLMATFAYSIVFNQQDNTGNDTFEVMALNPIKSAYPVGLGLYTDRHGLPNISGSDVYFNNNHLGFIFGSDISSENWNYSGVKGHFYYQENELFGLDDDVANETMSASDGLADVSPLIDMLETSVHLRIEHIAYPNNTEATTNNSIGFFLAYTTPCQPFETTLTEEVETCRGDTVHLLATGGMEYEWLPQEDLSCYNCPNPVFEGDSSKVYTVRIWNTDSCSKVLPVKVNVHDVPQSVSLSTSVATCSENDGALAINNVSGGTSPYLYNIGGSWSTNPLAFDELAGGDYTLTVKDQHDCVLQQDFTIAEENPAQAAFTANPQSGTAPLTVEFLNQSTGTNHQEWSVGDSISNAFNFSYNFDSAGSYPVQLISWYNEPHCADTAMATIIVNPVPHDLSHSIFMPTLYNPQNGDFFIETTNVQRVEFALYNAIGQHIFSNTVETADGQNALWNGANHARGYYFFRLMYWDGQGLEYKESGKVLLIR